MLTDKYITKIEGHGSLETNFDKGKVKLHIHEGERLFEGMLVGRTTEESHWITPRICGVCPIAHNLASLRACEDGLDIKINQTTADLRALMNCAQMMQSHMLHLFFLSLPDYLKIDRGTELAAKDPKSFKAALDIKAVSDEIATVVAGRNVHPITSTVGGFHKMPTKEDLKNLLAKIKNTRESAQRALRLCAKIKFPKLKVSLELVAQIDGKIVSRLSTDKAGKKEESSIKDYKKIITEEIKKYSTAKFGTYKGREMMVGSLARIYFMDPKKIEDVKKEYALVDFENPFHNNLAQAIELFLYHKEAEQILEKLLQDGLNDSIAKSGKKAAGKGIGSIEAPRGGLYHELRFNLKNNIITHANIITPTVQNLTSIEKSSNALLEQYKEKHSQKELEHLLEVLVRAYDPCITCSVH